jgi:hypothetical protein
MDDKRSTKAIPFPPEIGGNSGQFSQDMRQYLKGSLVHEKDWKNERQEATYFHLLWRALQKPAGKTGTVILFLSWLLLAMGSSVAVLAWVGALGMATGAALIGWSMFASYSAPDRPQNTQTQEPNHERVSPTQP